MDLRFDKQSFIINGKREFLRSGEFHYFRVPKQDWEKRLKLFKDCGGNCISSYVPWAIHEPQEGNIIFNDCSYRDLIDFLNLTKKLGFFVQLRPGPYQYTEMIGDGLPLWLYNNYPEVMLKDIDGNVVNTVSYLHPTFLSKVEKYFEAFAKVCKPFLTTNGGHVFLLQLDNELMGTHLWNGSADYNPETMGFGKEDGRFATWLKSKYSSIEELNTAYDTKYKSFGEVVPKKAKKNSVFEAKQIKDYREFYYTTVAEYALILKNMLNKFGLDVPVSHNIAMTSMVPLFKELSEKIKKDIILGIDFYYALDMTGPEYVTMRYFCKAMMAADFLKCMGHPYNIMELQAGTPFQFPPVLYEDMYFADMVNLAVGIKGVNHYVISGGPNPEDIGSTSEMYHYSAPISPDGKIRKTYYALKDYHKFMNSNNWLAGAKRISSVQIGYEWENLRHGSYIGMVDAKDTSSIAFNTERCLQYTLLRSKYSPEFCELSGELDIDKPLIFMSSQLMSESAQINIVDFVNKGGNAIILGTLPTKDLDFNDCSILLDALGGVKYLEITENKRVPFIDTNCGRVYDVSHNYMFDTPSNDETVFATHAGKPVGIKKHLGNGSAYLLASSWLARHDSQSEFLEDIFSKCNAKVYCYSNNRNLFTTYFENENKKGVFVINMFAGAQETVVTVKIGDNEKNIKVKIKGNAVKFIEV